MTVITDTTTGQVITPPGRCAATLNVHLHWVDPDRDVTLVAAETRLEIAGRVHIHGTGGSRLDRLRDLLAVADRQRDLLVAAIDAETAADTVDALDGMVTR